MTTTTITTSRPILAGTVLARLLAALDGAAAYHQSAEAPPRVLVWPDGAAQWGGVVARVREHRSVLTLGDYDLASQTGPAIWVRAALATLPANDGLPIVYLPGVSKQDLRAVETAPAEWQPLLHLQYQGTLFLQPNGKDWTLSAFFQNGPVGLGLTVEGSEATREALLEAAAGLLDRSVETLRLQQGGITADYLNQIEIDDYPGHILRWLNDPAGYRAGQSKRGWSAFRHGLREKYRLDPEKDGASSGARLLGEARPEHNWRTVWERFAQAPASYPHLPDLLRGAKPGTQQTTLFDAGIAGPTWPQDNEAAEAELRAALLALRELPAAAARAALAQLATEHAPRQASVWATLGQAPLAVAISELARLAAATATPVAAGDLPAMIAAYTGGGWQVDAAALAAQRAVNTAEDRAALLAALQPVYGEWLWEAAERFQAAVGAASAGGSLPASPASLAAAGGTCVLFADGLRYDLGAGLAELARAAGLTVSLSGALGPLPGVTPSAKPAQTPVADQLGPGPKLNVVPLAGGAVLAQPGLVKLLAGIGWQYLTVDEIGQPSATAHAWTELGGFDSYGHNHPHDLPAQAQRELIRLRERIVELLKTGWRRVMIVTDHGWLLTPAPMPKTELPQHLTVERKGRCSRLVDGAQPGNLQTVAWGWDASVRIAMAPASSCFEDGKRYEHGGLSLQECVVPTLVISDGSAPSDVATVTASEWRGMRVSITIAGRDGLRVDLRRRSGDPASSLARQVVAVADGEARLVVPDTGLDDPSGTPAIIVVLNDAGDVIAQQATIVGGE